MKNVCVMLVLLVVLLVLWDCYTARGRFEWTFDGVHHVFLVGNRGL